MKKMLVVLVVLMTTFTVVLPAAAGNGPGGGGNCTGNCAVTGTGVGTGLGQQGSHSMFVVTGTIATIGTNSVTINVMNGNKLAQASIGSAVPVTLTTTTRYLLRDGATITVVTFADLKVGQSVSVQGTIAGSTWTASRITVGASLNCLP